VLGGHDDGTAPARPRLRDPLATSPAVELRAATARVGGRTVWHDVDLSVGRGELVAVLGPNGAGKSTLLRVLLGLVPLTAGRALVLGARPGSAGPRIGYLPQRRSFDPGLRIRGVDVVRLGLDGHRWGVPLPRVAPSRRAGDRRVTELVERVGASAYAQRPIGECSGGEQQRLLIAQALARDPVLLLLDEPLDSLDLPNQVAVMALIERIRRDDGVTVVIVAHDVNPVLSYLDRVVYLAGGAAAIGRPAEVITTETLSRLFGVPIEVLRASDGRLVVVGQPEAPTYHPALHPAAHRDAG
jgi:zinc/manganese transport system ATP-binding protein